LTLGGSGPTPDRTRPHGVGNISSMSTATSISSEASAAFSKEAAAKKPDGPEPTTATWYGRILEPSVRARPRRKGLKKGWASRAGAHDGHLDAKRWRTASGDGAAGRHHGIRRQGPRRSRCRLWTPTVKPTLLLLTPP